MFEVLIGFDFETGEFITRPMTADEREAFVAAVAAGAPRN
jgi:hypothetical protein